MVVEEEYLLLDGIALLSAVGGTMGIMLGWSVLDFAGLISGAVEGREDRGKGRVRRR